MMGSLTAAAVVTLVQGPAARRQRQLGCGYFATTLGRQVIFPRSEGCPALTDAPPLPRVARVDETPSLCRGATNRRRPR
jgi:hypothetical protein